MNLPCRTKRSALANSSRRRSVIGAGGLTLTAFVTYDKRLLAAAAEIGLPTAAPGVS
jgi:hypothetical protein